MHLELVLWKEKNRQTFSQTHQERKASPNNQKWKRSHNQHHKNTKDHKRLLQTIIFQQNGQPEETDKLHFIQYPKNKSGRSREYEQTDYK